MKRLFQCLIFLLLGFTTFAQAPKWDWVKGFGGNAQNYFESITTDIDGNVVAVGSFTSDTFYYGNKFLVKSANGYSDFLLIKISPMGNVLWAKKTNCGLSGYAIGHSIVVDKQNNIYAAGDFESSILNFGGANTIGSGLSNNQYDFFIAKYDKNGNIIWARDYGDDYVNDNISSIQIDRNNNLYLVGKSQTANDTLALGINKFSLQGAVTYVAKIDSNGNGLWLRGVGNNIADEIWSSTLDYNGCIAITGNLNVANEPIATYVSLHAGHYLAKFDSVGNFLWAKIPNYQSIGRNYGVVKKDVQNNLIVAGSFS
ncbi:MAG: hypothetical protein RJA07_404 [Bacteroidota bacterium]|jgi:hypothetical protein